ncbi:MAG TPA: monofunctional biosynthetic peptidoglycan transglycosylase [Methylophilaceae bacterium]|nr:monofunctional biosynthetic peptidoglycan transglycosylase [Methylophilaceae bacterium]
MSFKNWLARGLLALILLIVAYQLWIFLHICWWVRHNPSSSALMENQLEVLQEKNAEAELKYQWRDYAKISNNLKRAVIASEDARFLEHEGFDWQGIQDAYERNLKKGRIVAGGSTISQQLAKNLFLSTRRTPWRKLEEVVITVMLEQMMSKRRILEIYLNVIEWGNGIFGAEAAARHYFGISAAGLSASQAAKLAAMIPNPRYYDKHRSTRYLSRRTGTIQARMHLVAVP